MEEAQRVVGRGERLVRLGTVSDKEGWVPGTSCRAWEGGSLDFIGVQWEASGKL